MKKIILSLVLCFGTLGAFADSAAPIVKFTPFLTGYNVWLQTNGGGAAEIFAGTGVPQVWFTTKQGQIVQSLTNNYVNGGFLSSNAFPDAFQLVPIAADANGDYNANASLVAVYGNTNWIPIAVTNSAGTYFITNWTLSLSQFPNWMYPATTNLYTVGLGGAANTNTIDVKLYKVYAMSPDGSSSGNTNFLIDTASAYTVTFRGGGATPTIVSSNLPSTLLQGAKWLAVQVGCLTNSVTAGASGGILLNQLGIIQPVP